MITLNKIYTSTIKNCYICDDTLAGWGGINMTDTKGICKKCMNLIRSLDKNTGPAEGLQKKMDHWNQKDKEIEIAQAINLAQNHALKVIQPTVEDKGTVLNLIEVLYPYYLNLLIKAKQKLNNK